MSSPPTPQQVRKRKLNPIDLETQCGVTFQEGRRCARSLLCKSHSMRAKRAVVGRSNTWDILWAELRRKKQKEAERVEEKGNEKEGKEDGDDKWKRQKKEQAETEDHPAPSSEPLPAPTEKEPINLADPSPATVPSTTDSTTIESPKPYKSNELDGDLITPK